MARVRLGVVLNVPSPVAAEIDGLRRACGGDQPVWRVPSHVTLVPPVNVRAEELGAALAVVRRAAATRAGAGPIELRLGPAAMFHPASETLYLPVDDRDGAVQALRDEVFRPPLARPLQWPFVPHVTLAEGIDESRARAAVAAMADYRVTVAVDRLHLLEERYQGIGEGRVRRRWTAVADAPFQAPVVVGRGGVELDLYRSQLADPEATAMTGPPGPLPSGAVPRTVVARRRVPGEAPGSPDRLVGVARGWERDGHTELVAVYVVEDQRRQGIARQLRLAFHALEPAEV